MHTKDLTVRPTPSLAALTTLKVGGVAIAAVVLESRAALHELQDALSHLGGKAVCLGQGSNILAGPGALPLVLLRLGAGFKSAEFEKSAEDASAATIYAGAGTPLQLLLGRTIQQGLGGLTGLAGIPGNVGGAVAMNAGSFGAEVKDALEAVEVFSLERGLERFEASSVEMGYRHFAIPELVGKFYIICGAWFRLQKQESAKLKAHFDECMLKKKSSQPVGAASAGCVFKNHPLGPAGKLIEEAGLKGQSCGGMMFSNKHANFMVNTGKGHASEALELIELAKEKVFASSGAKLETEVKIWL